jgi:hypothetical protein
MKLKNQVLVNPFLQLEIPSMIPVSNRLEITDQDHHLDSDSCLHGIASEDILNVAIYQT